MANFYMATQYMTPGAVIAAKKIQTGEITQLVLSLGNIGLRKQKK
jgi:hypothetical protein